MNQDEMVWYEASENEDGVTSIAMTPVDGIEGVGRIVGYNGIVKGDQVEYGGEIYTIVMVSRLGHFGLSKTGELPYTLAVSPTEVKKTEKKVERGMVYQLFLNDAFYGSGSLDYMNELIKDYVVTNGMYGREETSFKIEKKRRRTK